MLEALIALAALAGNTVVAAATTDAWEAGRRKFARLLGRGDPKKEQLAGKRLDQTRQQLGRVSGQELEKAQADLGKVWQVRMADLLEEDPAWRPSCATWWRRSGRSCRAGWCRRRIIRSRPGGM
jgi:hypothetical protein